MSMSAQSFDFTHFTAVICVSLVLQRARSHLYVHQSDSDLSSQGKFVGQQQRAFGEMTASTSERRIICMHAIITAAECQRQHESAACSRTPTDEVIKMQMAKLS